MNALDEPDRRDVVIVDDEEEQLEVLGDFLNLLGVSHARALNGFAAVSLIKKVQPKVVLVDIKMPGLGGVDVARQIKDAGTVYPKVILMSGYAEAVRDANLLDLNLFTVIDKPVPLKILGRYIKQILAMD